MSSVLPASPASNLSRFHEILKSLTESDEGKLHILKVVYDVWRNHPEVQTTHITRQLQRLEPENLSSFSI